LWYGQLAYGQMRKNGQQELGALEEQEASKWRKLDEQQGTQES
jgi:hypothetical protein